VLETCLLYDRPRSNPWSRNFVTTATAFSELPPISKKLSDNSTARPLLEPTTAITVLSKAFSSGLRRLASQSEMLLSLSEFQMFLYLIM
jgi:hypothetical protein